MSHSTAWSVLSAAGGITISLTLFIYYLFSDEELLLSSLSSRGFQRAPHYIFAQLSIATGYAHSISPRQRHVSVDFDICCGSHGAGNVNMISCELKVVL